MRDATMLVLVTASLTHALSPRMCEPGCLRIKPCQGHTHGFADWRFSQRRRLKLENALAILHHRAALAAWAVRGCATM